MSVASIPDSELLKRAIKAARKGRGYQPRWLCVSKLFCLGSTYSRELCERFDINPDEKVRS